MNRALVVSGGGSKGAFAVGAIRKLQQQYTGLAYTHFVGTSTGSLIVPLAAIGELDLLEQLYTTVKTSDIITKFNIGDRLNTHSIFDSTPLWNLITTYYDDARCQQLLNGSTKVYIATTCLQSSQLVIYTTDPAPEPVKHYEIISLTSPDHLRKAILASASQPVFMPPVKVDKNVPGAVNPGYQYVDGGVRQYVGIEMAIDQGAEEIFAILLSAEGDDPINKEFKSLFDILQQTIDIFTLDVGKNDLIIPEQYNEALSYIDSVKKKMKREGVATSDIEKYFSIRGHESPWEDKVPLSIFIIRPDAPLGGGPGGLEFNPTEMKGMVTKGRQAAGDFIAGLEPGQITWA